MNQIQNLTKIRNPQNALILTLPVQIPDKEKKIKLNIYFHTSLRCLKKFYEDFSLHKTFREPQRSAKIKI